MKKIIICLSLNVFLISCAGVQTGIKFENISLKTHIIDNVPLNTIISNEIGDKLIVSGEEEYQDAIQILESPEYVTFGVSSTKYLYDKNQVFPLSGSTKEWFLYYDKKNPNYGVDYQNYGIDYGIAVNKLDSTLISPFVKSSMHNGTFATKIGTELKTKPVIYTNRTCPNCFKQEFVFNGKVGNNLKFIYREYVNDLARPAFNQDLQYDLNDSNIVGFKGLLIEVIKATNTNIEYKILSSFNKKN